MQTSPGPDGQLTEALDRLTRLQSLTAALSQAVTSDQVADAILTQGLSVLRANAGVIYRLSDDRTEFVIVGVVGYAEEAASPWKRFPAGARMPISDAVREGRPVLLATLAERNARYPEIARVPGLQVEGAVVALPMAIRDRPVGAIGLRFPTERVFSEQDLAFMLALAGLCAQALDRARLYDRERQVRERAERAEGDLKMQARVLESMTEGVNVSDEQGVILYTNPAEDRIFGYGQGELVGRPVTVLNTYPPEENERIVREVIEQLRAKGAWFGEFSNRKKDGTPFTTFARITALEMGGKNYWVCVQEDITEQKEATERLLRARRESEELLALLDTLLSNAPVGFAFVNRDLRFVRVNHALAAMNGLSAGDHLGRTVQDVVPDLWPKARPIYEGILAGGEAVTNVEVCGHTAATRGEVRCWLVSYYPVRIQGEVIGVGVIVNDVTEAKRLEEQLRQAQKMEGIGRLAGGIAHDFNNLLTVINGFSGLLLADAPEHDPARPMLQDIHRAGERAAALTRQLLAFGRKQVLQPRVLDLNALVADMHKMLARVIGEDVELVTVPAPGLARIQADASQVEQVVMNLAVNARDAMPGGGRLTIETAAVALDDLRAEAFLEVRPGAYVLLAVSDTGTGMDGDTQAHLFEPFFTTKGPGQGTGLGLATVYGIVKQSGGHIKVYSEVGRGTTFKVYFPAIEEVEQPGESEPVVAEPPGGEEVVLLVEDEEGVRRLTQNVLERLGYRVLVAAVGAEALKVAAGHQGVIDLLVTDVVMPQMSGPQVAAALLPLRPGMKVLYLSGHADDAVVRHGVLGAGQAFLQKPFTAAALAAKVREVLDQKG